MRKKYTSCRYELGLLMRRGWIVDVPDAHDNFKWLMFLPGVKQRLMLRDALF
jgi:hypothetical protein